MSFSLFFLSKASENRTLGSTRFVIPEIAWKDRTSMDKQWTSNPMLMAPKVRKIAADHPLFHHISTRQRCRGNYLTLKTPMKEPPDFSCWQINWIPGNFITDWCPCNNYQNENNSNLWICHTKSPQWWSPIWTTKRRRCDFSIQLFGCMFFSWHIDTFFHFRRLPTHGATIQVFGTRRTAADVATGAEEDVPRGCQTSASKIAWFNDSCSRYAFLKMRKFSLDAMRCHMSSYKYRYNISQRSGWLEKNTTKKNKKNISNSNCKRRHKWHRTRTPEHRVPAQHSQEQHPVLGDWLNSWTHRQNTSIKTLFDLSTNKPQAPQTSTNVPDTIREVWPPQLLGTKETQETLAALCHSEHVVRHPLSVTRSRWGRWTIAVSLFPKTKKTPWKYLTWESTLHTVSKRPITYHIPATRGLSQQPPGLSQFGSFLLGQALHQIVHLQQPLKDLYICPWAAPAFFLEMKCMDVPSCMMKKNHDFFSFDLQEPSPAYATKVSAYEGSGYNKATRKYINGGY